MGNCTIVVHLTGAHHNKKNKHDANRMAAKFVDELMAAGHNVIHACFTNGASESLIHATPTYDAIYDKDHEPTGD